MENPSWSGKILIFGLIKFTRILLDLQEEMSFARLHKLVFFLWFRELQGINQRVILKQKLLSKVFYNYFHLTFFGFFSLIFFHSKIKKTLFKPFSQSFGKALVPDHLKLELLEGHRRVAHNAGVLPNGPEKRQSKMSINDCY